MTDKDKIKKFCSEQSYLTENENLFVKNLRTAGLDDNQIVLVINITLDICHACYDNNSMCGCDNDE